MFLKCLWWRIILSGFECFHHSTPASASIHMYCNSNVFFKATILSLSNAKWVNLSFLSVLQFFLMWLNMIRWHKNFLMMASAASGFWHLSPNPVWAWCVRVSCSFGFHDLPGLTLCSNAPRRIRKCSFSGLTEVKAAYVSSQGLSVHACVVTVWARCTGAEEERKWRRRWTGGCTVQSSIK